MTVAISGVTSTPSGLQPTATGLVGRSVCAARPREATDGSDAITATAHVGSAVTRVVSSQVDFSTSSLNFGGKSAAIVKLASQRSPAFLSSFTRST